MTLTVEEALEILGGLVARAGGEGDEALDRVKDECYAAHRLRKSAEARRIEDAGGRV